MDCLEFRRHLEAEPRARDEAFIAHRDSCHLGCTEAWWRAQRLERRIDHALAINAPEPLADRILLAHATRLRTGARRRWQIGLAMAASLVIALGVGFVALRRVPADPLPQLAIAHMRGEEAPALASTAPVSDASLRAGFAARGLALRAMPRGAVYVHDCQVGPYRTVHLVFREDDKPVTALYFLGRGVAGSRDFRQAGVQGREVPLDRGTLVMLGDNPHGFTDVERTLRDALLGPPR